MSELSESSDNKLENKIIFMNFFAGWCSSCQVQDSIIERLKIKFGDKIEFIKIDVDIDVYQGFKLIDKYNIRDIPTMIIEKDGKILARFVGVTDIFILDKKIREIIGKRK